MIDLLRRLDLFSSIEECVEVILADRGCCSVVSFLNAHAVNLAYDDDAFRQSLLKSTYLLRDGVGTEIACSILSEEAGNNLNGSDLIPLILEKFVEFKGSVFFFGGDQSTTDRLMKIYKPKGVEKYFFMNGYLDDQDYVDCLKLESSGRGLVILGMGMPKQEFLALKFAKIFPDSDLIVLNGGAILDRLAGVVSRGPIIFRVLKIEWFYRLIMSPRRLFKRYIIGNPLFIYRAIVARIG